MALSIDIPDDSAIHLSGVNYTYVDDWTRKRSHAIKNLSLTIRSGESFGFLGNNGAGKTTTIKSILNLIKISSGSISLFGTAHTQKDARRDIGYLPEQPYFYDHLTVVELLEFYAGLAGLPKGQRKSRIEEVLALLKIESRSKARMRTLSKGLTQRVGLAQAIIANPKLLILDEPFSGLDPLGRKEFKDILASLKKQGVTIFMSSHILGDVEFLCDRVSIMTKGEVRGVFDLNEGFGALSSTTYELTLRSVTASFPGTTQVISENRFTRLVFTERNLAEKALSAALAQNAGVESFEVNHGSLEDLFVKLVSENSPA